jgi:hypothetical protein
MYIHIFNNPKKHKLNVRNKSYVIELIRVYWLAVQHHVAKYASDIARISEHIFSRMNDSPAVVRSNHF